MLLLTYTHPAVDELRMLCNIYSLLLELETARQKPIHRNSKEQPIKGTPRYVPLKKAPSAEQTPLIYDHPSLRQRASNHNNA
jgi:hypothetical protein